MLSGCFCACRQPQAELEFHQRHGVVLRLNTELNLHQTETEQGNKQHSIKYVTHDGKPCARQEVLVRVSSVAPDSDDSLAEAAHLGSHAIEQALSSVDEEALISIGNG